MVSSCISACGFHSVAFLLPCFHLWKAKKGDAFQDSQLVHDRKKAAWCQAKGTQHFLISISSSQAHRCPNKVSNAPADRDKSFWITSVVSHFQSTTPSWLWCLTWLLRVLHMQYTHSACTFLLLNRSKPTDWMLKLNRASERGAYINPDIVLQKMFPKMPRVKQMEKDFKRRRKKMSLNQFTDANSINTLCTLRFWNLTAQKLKCYWKTNIRQRAWWGFCF